MYLTSPALQVESSLYWQRTECAELCPHGSGKDPTCSFLVHLLSSRQTATTATKASIRKMMQKMHSVHRGNAAWEHLTWWKPPISANYLNCPFVLDISKGNVSFIPVTALVEYPSLFQFLHKLTARVLKTNGAAIHFTPSQERWSWWIVLSAPEIKSNKSTHNYFS